MANGSGQIRKFVFHLWYIFFDKFCNLGNSGIEYVFIFLYSLCLSSLRFPFFLFSFISPRLSDCGSVPPAPLANVAVATAMGVRVTDWCRKNGRDCLVGAGESFFYWIGSLFFFYERLNCLYPHF